MPGLSRQNFALHFSPLLAGLALAGCVASTAPTTRVIAVKPIDVASPPTSAPEQLTEVEMASAQMTWALRGGLNVAALLCQDRMITANYNKMLRIHRNLFNEAYAAEQARFNQLHGSSGQARHSQAMTRLYNGFASVPDRRRFCTVATRIVADAVAMPSHALATRARRALTTLEPGAVQIVNSAS